MTVEYVLRGLDCPNCAVKIEGSVRALKDVSYAAVNFTASTLRVETEGDETDLRKEIERIVYQHEPDVRVEEKADAGRVESAEVSIAKIVQMSIGALGLAAAMILERFFAVHEYALLAMYATSFLLLGGEIVLRAARNIAKGQVFDENFLMALATIGAFAIGEYAEAVGVMLFYQVGEFFQDMAVNRSRKTIASLMDIRPDFANVWRDGRLERVAPGTLSIGDVILVKPGERIPLDGVVLQGESMLDTSALTGESVPRRASPSDTVLSGAVNQSGALTIEVARSFGESTASKIIELVENAAANKAPTENFITKFARYYTPAVVVAAALIALIPPLLLAGAWAEWIRRGLIFLVISCPCALVISIPLSFFGGIGGASRKGILVKGGNYLQALNDLDMVVFDKTGTLTKGVFKVTSVEPAEGISRGELLEAAARAEALCDHPIAVSILREYGGEVDKGGIAQYEQLVGSGVSARVAGSLLLAGNHRLMSAMGVDFEKSAGMGAKVYVAKDGVFMGCVTISDQIRSDSRAAVAGLRAKGVRKIVMLTGDDPVIAQAVAGELMIDEAHGGLLPQEKVEKVQALNQGKRRGGKLAFVGDGINDAPVLAMADIGVAMGGLGSDAAIEAADVVLMTDEPSKLCEAVEIAGFTQRVVWQNIAFALGVKVLFLLLGAMGVANLWEAVFADVGVALLAVLNAMRVMRK